MILTRQAAAVDHDAIDTVVAAAFLQRFNSTDEVRLIRELRAGGDVVAERVALVDGSVVGHVMVSRLFSDQMTGLVALAPVAVSPDLQRGGIGQAMVDAVLADCQAAAERAAVVLGDPEYYQRFGFDAALARNLVAPFRGSHFMALEWEAGCIQPATAIRYAAAFGLDPA